jgi:hypothetical protein
MRNFFQLLILTFGLISYSQQSNYYAVDVNQNINANVQKDIDVSGNINVNKHISTIDYGQLALANAQKEKNRLESQKYIDQREKEIYLSIAENPVLAYDYGTPAMQELDKKFAKQRGFKKLSWGHQLPHKSLFIFTTNGRWENVSADNITTEIIFIGTFYNKENLPDRKEVEKRAKMDLLKIGQLNKDVSSDGNETKEIFVHNKDTNRATVFGVKGYVGTLVWEDDYQYTITDNYESFDSTYGNGITHLVKIRYYGDKDEVTFEQLEGRKYYLKRLIEKIISSGRIQNFKY